MHYAARPPARKRRISRGLRRIAGGIIASLALAISIPQLAAQVPGKNVNLVAGNTWPDGDPFLQRQNEPSVAVSSRNVLHMLAGGNDYRTVDLPGLPATKPNGDAWLGVFKSLDGGQTWKSNLLPGYPQDTSPIGLTSPLKGYDAAADPTVRTGSNGLFYYSGIVFQRNVPVATNRPIPDDGPAESSMGATPSRENGPTKRKLEREQKARLAKARERKAERERTEKRERKEARERKEKRERLDRDRKAHTAANRQKGVREPSTNLAIANMDDDDEEEEEADDQGGSTTSSAVFVSTFIDLNNQETGDPIRYVRTSIVDSDPGARFLDKQWTAVDIPRSGAAMCTLDVTQEDGTIVHQTFPGGRVYVAYTAFIGPESDGKAQIMLRYSADCGATWSPARDISTIPDPDINDDGIVNNTDLNISKALVGKRCGDVGFDYAADLNKDCVINLLDLTPVSKALGKTYSTVRRVPQGASLAINPATGTVSVTWREISVGGLPDVIQYAQSTNFGIDLLASAHDLRAQSLRSGDEPGFVPYEGLPDDRRRRRAHLCRVVNARPCGVGSGSGDRRRAHRDFVVGERHDMDGARCRR